MFGSVTTRFVCKNTVTSLRFTPVAIRTFASEKKTFDPKAAMEKLRERARKDPFISAPVNKSNPQVFFDIAADGKALGRIVMEVRVDKAPKAAENFRALCTGEKGNSSSGVALTYKNSKFFGWMKNYYINGGDISSNNGKGGESIYGPTFTGEITDLPMGLGSVHLLAHNLNSREAAVGKRNVVNSRFSIMTLDLPSVLTGMGVVVAQVLKGIEIVEDIEYLPIKIDEKGMVPQSDVVIVNCGQLADSEKILSVKEVTLKEPAKH